MCTVSWVRVGTTGYALFCNRDEQRTRAPEEAPAVFERDGIRYISPRDSECGGTWVTVNEFGVAVTLLNGYAESRGAEREEWTSRGLLVDQLAHAGSARDFEARLKSVELGEYRPFQMLAIDAGGGLACWRWDGLELALRLTPEREQPLVSSGVEAEKVRAHRRRVLREQVAREGELTPELLEAYHRNHEGGPSELSTCMHREDAKTRSLCRVVVNEREARFDYAPGSPCKTDWGAGQSLALRAPGPSRSQGPSQ